MQFVIRCGDNTCARLTALTLNNTFSEAVFEARGLDVYVRGQWDLRQIDVFNHTAMGAISLWEMAGPSLQHLVA